MRKVSIVAAAAAVALAAALLAGCADTASSSAASSSSASSPAASTEAAPDSTATADNATGDANAAGSEAGSMGTDAAQAAAYSAEGLKPVLDEFVAYEADTAGGSLQTAYAAAMLVEYAAQVGPTADPMTVGNDVQAWLDALTEEQKTALMTNWAGIKSTAESIAADPTSQKELLDTAGYPSDLGALDLSGVTGILTAVDGKLGAVK